MAARIRFIEATVCDGSEDGAAVGVAVGAVVAHTLLRHQAPTVQSEFTRQGPPGGQGGQSTPPQSTPVSPGSWTPLPQLPGVGLAVGAGEGEKVGDGVGDTVGPGGALHCSLADPDEKKLPLLGS